MLNYIKIISKIHFIKCDLDNIWNSNNQWVKGNRYFRAWSVGIGRTEEQGNSYSRITGWMKMEYRKK